MKFIHSRGIPRIEKRHHEYNYVSWGLGLYIKRRGNKDITMAQQREAFILKAIETADAFENLSWYSFN